MPQIDKKFLSQGRLSLGGGVPTANARSMRDPTGGAGAGLFSGARLRAPEFISSNIPAAIDKVGPIVQSENVEKLAQVMNEAAIKKADKQAELYARETLIQARDEFRDRMFGERGYLTLQGGDAVKARLKAQQDVEQITQSYLDSVPAHVRSKLFAGLNAEREQTLNNIAQYANVQEKQWQQDVRAREVEDFKVQMSEFGLDFDLTDSSISALTRKLYPDHPDGTVNESSALQRQNLEQELLKTHIEQLIYTNQPGITGAFQRYEQVRDRLGVDDQIAMRKTLMSAVNTYNSQLDQDERRAKEAVSRRKDQSYRTLLARTMNDDPADDPTNIEISELLEANLISPPAAKVLSQQLDADFQNDITEYDRLTTMINEIDLQNLTGAEWVREEVMTSKEVDLETKEQLLDKITSLTTGNRTDRMKQAMDVIRVATQEEDWQTFNIKRKVLELRMHAERELQARAAAGEDPLLVADEILGQQRYDPRKLIPNSDLPMMEMEDGSLQRIKSMSQLEQWGSTVYREMKPGPWKDKMRENFMLTRNILLYSGQEPGQQGNPSATQSAE